MQIWITLFFHLCIELAGLAQLVRASVSQSGGRQFDPDIPQPLVEQFFRRNLTPSNRLLIPRPWF